MAFSSHKIGAPSGCGVLWAGRGAKVSPLLRGKQEKGRRGGTENLLGAALMGEAAKALDPSAWAARVGPCRDRIERAVMARVPGARINGEGAPRVAGTMNVSFEGLGGEGLVMALDLAGYSVSSGSACSSGAIEPSHVLLAMGRSKAEATAAIRLSLSDVIEDEVIEGFIGALQSIVARMARPSASANLSTC